MTDKSGAAVSAEHLAAAKEITDIFFAVYAKSKLGEEIQGRSINIVAEIIARHCPRPAHPDKHAEPLSEEQERAEFEKWEKMGTGDHFIDADKLIR